MKFFQNLRVSRSNGPAPSERRPEDTRKWVAFCFRLLLGRSVAADTVEQRHQQDASEQPFRIARSDEFRTKSARRFVAGQMTQPSTGADFEVEELRKAILIAGGMPPSETSGAVTWSRAFEMFCMAMRPAGKIWPDLGAKSTSGEVQALNAALDTCAKIDSLVEAGRIGDAFRLARSSAEAGGGYIVPRYCALTWALCPDPIFVEDILDVPADGTAAPLAAAMRHSLAGAQAADAPGIAQIAATTLPPCYGPLLAARHGIEQLDDVLVAWSLLSRPVADADWHGTITVVMPADGARDVSPADGINLILVGAEQPANGATGVADWAQAKAMLLAQGDEQPVVLLDRPLPISSGLTPSLGQVMAQDAAAYCTTDRFVATADGQAIGGLISISSDICGYAGRTAAIAMDGFDFDHGKSRPNMPTTEEAVLFHARLEQLPDPESLDVVVLSTAPDTAADHCLTIADDTSCTKAAADLRAFLQQRDLSGEHPVLLLSPDIAYPADYVETALRVLARNGGRLPVCAGPICLEKDDFVVPDQPDTPGHMVKAGFLALSAMSASDMLDRLEAAGDVPAFKAACAFPEMAVWSDELAATSSLNSDVLAEWLDALSASPAMAHAVFCGIGSPISGLTAHISPLGMPTGQAIYRRRIERIRRDILRFASGDTEAVQPFVDHISSGRLKAFANDLVADELCQAVDAAFADKKLLSSLDIASFDALIELAQRLGLQASAAQKLYASALSLCTEDFRKIGSVFSFLNGWATTADFHALLGEFSTQVALGSPRVKVANRTLDVLCAYASPGRLIAFVDAAIRSGNADLLTHRSVREKIAARLFSQSELPAAMPDQLRLLLDDLRQLVPPADRMRTAIVSGDRPALLTALQMASARQDAVEWLSRQLTSYTAELTSMAITSGDWPYLLYSDADTAANMAAILGDRQVIEARLQDDADPEWAALARARLGDFSALDQVYAQWCAPWNITPVNFTGDRIAALFAGLLQAPGPQVQDAPLVSVIMTIFNGDPELLALSIRSILAQTHGRIEILLVDDCSDADLALTYEATAATDPRIRYFRCERNTGPYLGRNLALRHAGGDFVAIQDADDFAHPERFAFQLAQFAEHPLLQACATTHLRFDANAHLQFEHGMKLTGDGTMSTMFRRAIFDRLGPFAPVRSRGDVEYRERIRKALGPGAFRLFPCPMQFCYAAPTTLSQTVARERAQHLADFRQIIDRQSWRIEGGTPRRMGDIAIPDALRP